MKRNAAVGRSRRVAGDRRRMGARRGRCAVGRCADGRRAANVDPLRTARRAAVQAWLEADGDAADRLHRYLEARVLNASAETPPPAIVVRAWIGTNGAVTRVEFASLGNPDADATLRQLLTAGPLAEPPPPDMLQPLRVRLRLAPNPDAAAAARFGGAPDVRARARTWFDIVITYDVIALAGR